MNLYKTTDSLYNTTTENKNTKLTENDSPFIIRDGHNKGTYVVLTENNYTTFKDWAGSNKQELCLESYYQYKGLN